MENQEARGVLRGQPAYDFVGLGRSRAEELALDGIGAGDLSARPG